MSLLEQINIALIICAVVCAPVTILAGIADLLTWLQTRNDIN